MNFNKLNFFPSSLFLEVGFISATKFRCKAKSVILRAEIFANNNIPFFFFSKILWTKNDWFSIKNIKPFSSENLKEKEDFYQTQNLVKSGDLINDALKCISIN